MMGKKEPCIITVSYRSSSAWLCVEDFCCDKAQSHNCFCILKQMPVTGDAEQGAWFITKQPFWGIPLGWNGAQPCTAGSQGQAGEKGPRTLDTAGCDHGCTACALPQHCCAVIPAPKIPTLGCGFPSPPPETAPSLAVFIPFLLAKNADSSLIWKLILTNNILGRAKLGSGDRTHCGKGAGLGLEESMNTQSCNMCESWCSQSNRVLIIISLG